MKALHFLSYLEIGVTVPIVVPIFKTDFFGKDIILDLEFKNREQLVKSLMNFTKQEKQNYTLKLNFYEKNFLGHYFFSLKLNLHYTDKQ